MPRPRLSERLDRGAGVEADARLRAGRLRQDDAAGRVAGGGTGADAVTGRGLALARPGRQPAGVLLDLPDRRAADGRARSRRERARAPAVAAAGRRSRRSSPRCSTTSAPSDDDVVLVLDDYHVIDAREVQDGMAFLLDHLPPRLHLVIASRADPALPLARLRARGELVEIRAADLRFTPDEAAAYLNEAMGLAAHRRRTSRRWRGAPRAGSPRSSWRRSRCRAGTTSPASSPASPATTATSSTTWSRRCCSASPRTCGASCCRPPSSTG